MWFKFLASSFLNPLHFHGLFDLLFLALDALHDSFGHFLLHLIGFFVFLLTPLLLQFPLMNSGPKFLLNQFLHLLLPPSLPNLLLFVPNPLNKSRPKQSYDFLGFF